MIKILKNELKKKLEHVWVKCATPAFQTQLSVTCSESVYLSYWSISVLCHVIPFKSDSWTTWRWIWVNSRFADEKILSQSQLSDKINDRVMSSLTTRYREPGGHLCRHTPVYMVSLLTPLRVEVVAAQSSLKNLIFLLMNINAARTTYDDFTV